MDINKFKCNVCNKYYKSYQSLWNHKKKFHSILTQNNLYLPEDNSISPHNNSNIIVESINKLTCKYCSKIYSRMDNLNRHKKKCKLKEEIYNQNEELIKQNNEIIKNQKELLKQNSELIKTGITPTTTNNNITNNNTNNGTINNTTNNINVFKFGLETVLENLPKDEAVNLLRMTGFKSLVKSILLTYFSKRFPEGHILYMNNINDKHAVVYDKDKGKEILEPIDTAIDMAIQHRIVELDELKDKHKDELNEVQLNNINNIVDNEYPPHVCDKFKKMAVKHKGMVKDTLDKVVSK